MATGVDAETVPSAVASSSGWVLTQATPAATSSSTTAYAASRQPRREGATASVRGSGVTDVMAGG